jgi:hypothetical protein
MPRIFNKYYVSERREAVATCDRQDEYQEDDGDATYSRALNVIGKMREIDGFESYVALIMTLKLRE